MSDDLDESSRTDKLLHAFAEMFTESQRVHEARQTASDGKIDKLVESVTELTNVSKLDRKDAEQTRKDYDKLDTKVDSQGSEISDLKDVVLVMEDRQNTILKNKEANKKLLYGIIGTLITVITIGAYTALTTTKPPKTLDKPVLAEANNEISI